MTRGRAAVPGAIALLVALAGCQPGPACAGCDPGRATCGDGVTDGAETDVDCGGPLCGACASGGACRLPRDCATGSCGAHVCGPRRTLGFGAPADLAAGMPLAHPGYPSIQRLAVGDFDGDGARDLAVPSTEGVAVTVLFGDGAGGVASRLRVPTRGRPTAALGADLDGDGRDDLIVGFDGGALAVARGAPGRQLLSPVDIAWPDSTFTLAAGDLDGDGRLDVAAAPVQGGAVTLGLGDGQGGFAPRVAWALAGGSAYFLAAGDLDGDGRADLAVSEPWQQLDLLLAVPGPGLAPSQQYPIPGTSVDSSAIADVDHDGHADVVVAHGDGLRTLRGDGKGQVQEAWRGALAGHTDALVAVDLDADGHLDLALARDAAGVVLVLLGDGTGAFTASLELPVAGRAIGLCAGDLDGDGLPDLIAAEGLAGVQGPTGGLRVFLNRSR